MEVSEEGIADMGAAKSPEGKVKIRPFVNFRVLVVCAIGTVFGVSLYAGIRFGGFAFSDLLFFALFLPLCLFPVSKKRVLALCLLFPIFASVGCLGLHFYTENFLKGVEDGTYEASGTVILIAVGNGYTSAELRNVTIDGLPVDGKLSVSLPSEAVRTGDIVRFTANIHRASLPTGTQDSYHFVSNVRYLADAASFVTEGRSSDPILRLNALLYDTLHAHMDREEANISYALLTGNSRMVDRGFMTAVRIGGIAHIFAVSGLHIGILYGAALLLCRPLKKYACLPALLLAFVYCTLCNFTVSSVRALIMCAALSVNGFLARKNDLLSSTGLAGTAVLIPMPAQWLSVGFRLSFGACLGLGLFSGSFSRGLSRIRLPRFLSDLLGATLSVEIFTFPIMLEAFGYFSVWGLLLNLLFVPLLPSAFLALMLCTFCALVIPPAAGFFLLFPEGVFALLLYLFALSDFGYVLCGFSLGAGAVVWLCAEVLLSERVRLSRRLKAAIALFAAGVFSLCVFVENSCFGGVVIDVSAGEDSYLVLIKTPEATVLLLNDTELELAEDFLMRRTNRVDAAIVLSDDGMAALGTAAFAGAAALYARTETATGFHENGTVFADSFTVGELSFRYETETRVMMTARGHVVCFDSASSVPIGADLDIQSTAGCLKYFLGYDIILKL